MTPPGVGENSIIPEPHESLLGPHAVEPAEAAETILHTPEHSPNNLPLELSSFVGREGELAEVKRLLESTRLLTLTGPGGCGKTRLALASASELVEGFKDGVWMVELASLADPSLVPQAVASTLGAREQPGRSLTETLSGYLGFKNVLVVLDNCEHLIEACATLAEALLRSCSGLRVLATSREALGITGEVAWSVPSLSLPDLRRLPHIDGLPRYESVRLFLERTEAIKPTFALTEQNAPAVAQICYRLDGIPLAIELAAARAKVLSVEEISERLDDCFGLLTVGSRTTMPRHRTLHATIDWSHEMLSEEEQTLFRRLSVFAGGFALNAAESVCAEGELLRDEVLDLLSHLIDKSLVVVQEKVGETHYRLLETVQQYGRKKLDASADAEEVRKRHARFYLALAEEAEPWLKGHQQVEWMERLEAENQNLRAATHWLVEKGEIETVVRLAWALRLFWYQRGHQGEGYRYAGVVLEKGDALPTVARARAFLVAAVMSLGFESLGRTQQLWEESFALFGQTGDRSGLALAMGGVGIMAMLQGDTKRASTFMEDSVRLFRELGDEWGVSSVLMYLGMVPFNRGDYEEATRYFEEALAISREIGNRQSGYVSLHNLAQTAEARGDHDGAVRLYLEGMRLALEVSDEAHAAYCLEELARLVGVRSEPERSVRLLGASEALLEAAGAPLYAYASDRVRHERWVEELRSRLSETAFGAAWAEGRTMTPEQAIEYALESRQPQEQASSPPSYPAGLSAREVEVLGLVARGMTNAEVAEKLFLSSRTIEWYLGSIYRKVGLHSRTEAARFAVEHGLL
jgi:predicted ATPase/DNA-binding CsgD family transcriptional regulator